MVSEQNHYGNARVGDVMTFGTDFLLANRGDFMVLRSGEKLPEITNLAITSKITISSWICCGILFRYQ